MKTKRFANCALLSCLVGLSLPAIAEALNSSGTISVSQMGYMVIAERDFAITGATQLVTPEGIRLFPRDLVAGRAATVVSVVPAEGGSGPVAEKVIVYETMSDAE